MQQQVRFVPFSVRYDQLGEEIESYRQAEHITIKTLSDVGRINHRTYENIRLGIDFKLNYYLRLFYALAANSEKEHFFSFLNRFLRIVLLEIRRMLKVNLEGWMSEILKTK